MRTLFIGGPYDGEWHDIPSGVDCWAATVKTEDIQTLRYVEYRSSDVIVNGMRVRVMSIPGIDVIDRLMNVYKWGVK